MEQKLSMDSFGDLDVQSSVSVRTKRRKNVIPVSLSLNESGILKTPVKRKITKTKSMRSPEASRVSGISRLTSPSQHRLLRMLKPGDDQINSQLSLRQFLLKRNQTKSFFGSGKSIRFFILDF